MKPCQLITLLTDFGDTDAYVGIMKGVIASIDPNLSVVDLTHAIAPQDLAAARFNLINAYPYFPAGTVHVAVVDPGVGGTRRAIALELTTGFLVGPDNGIFSGILETDELVNAVELTQSAFWRSPHPSTTFHGRDLFAPVGAHLARGVSLADLGSPIEPSSLVQLPIEPSQATPDGLLGSVQHIDHFGNIVTTIPAAAVADRHWSVLSGDRAIVAQPNYGAVVPGILLALIGSHGWVEIAANRDSAQAQLQLRVGDPIRVKFLNDK
jgi:S-adenosylmethionine hydrolase